jgi:2-desacetyl-2-hydroxyethyl bacteriochlorophyllide A dehydrogenase
MSVMKIVNIPEPGKAEVIEMEKPVPKPGEALIRLLYGGVCGSDLATYRGSFIYTTYPRIPGHEFSAEVVEVGPNDCGIKPGMIVTANPYYNCGECYSCKRGFVNCCTSNKTLGAQWDGIFRQYFTVPVERIYDGKGLDAQRLALVEPFCISYHAVKRANVKPGDKVLVVGAGPIGIFAMLAAKKFGAEVYISDVSKMRLEKAMAFGAKDVIHVQTEDFNARVQELTHGDGFDVCIECVGFPETFQNCIDAAAFRGRVVLVGIRKKNLDFQFSRIQTKELDIFGSRNALKEDFLELIDYLLSDAVDVQSMITSVYALEDAGQAFADLADHGDTMMKAMIRF